MTKTKWLIYTVLLGAIPIFTRLLIRSLATSETSMAWVNEADVIGFGLILAITNISGLEHNMQINERAKTTNIGLSLLLIVLLTALFAASSFQDLHAGALDIGKIRLASIILASACLIYSYAIWDRLLALKKSIGQ